MCQAIRELVADGRQEGIDIGYTTGKQEGIDIGKEMGISEGYTTGKQEGINIGKEMGICALIRSLQKLDQSIADIIAIVAEEFEISKIEATSYVNKYSI